MRGGFLDQDKATRLGIRGKPFQANIADRGPQLDALYIGARQRATSNVGEEVGLTEALLDQHKLAAADVGQAFWIGKVTGRQRQRVN